MLVSIARQLNDVIRNPCVIMIDVAKKAYGMGYFCERESGQLVLTNLTKEFGFSMDNMNGFSHNLFIFLSRLKISNNGLKIIGKLTFRQSISY